MLLLFHKNRLAYEVFLTRFGVEPYSLALPLRHLQQDRLLERKQANYLSWNQKHFSDPFRGGEFPSIPKVDWRSSGIDPDPQNLPRSRGREIGLGQAFYNLSISLRTSNIIHGITYLREKLLTPSRSLCSCFRENLSKKCMHTKSTCIDLRIFCLFAHVCLSLCVVIEPAYWAPVLVTKHDRIKHVGVASCHGAQLCKMEESR